MHEGARIAARLEAGGSFSACYESHRDEALRLAYLLSGDRQRAEDVVAEVFYKMYRRWAAGQIVRPRAYLRRAVANEVNSGFRRLARERAFASRHAAPVVCDADEQILDRDDVDALLAGLPPRQRTAVTLRYLHDLPEAEVARRMGTSVGTVKSNAARGLAALRAALAREVERAA